jgi:hypothetical protein
MGISSRPPREFSLTSAGTKSPGQVMSVALEICNFLSPRKSKCAAHQIPPRRAPNSGFVRNWSFSVRRDRKPLGNTDDR